MRRTRKGAKGGAIANTEKICVKPHSTFEACVKDFLEEKEFNRIKVPGDGNCFYHALTKFLKLSQNGSLPYNHHVKLRNMVVDKMIENIEDVAPYLTGDEDAADQIEALRIENEWNNDASDLVSQYASKALNIKIVIYDVKNPQKESKKFMRRINGINQYNIQPAKPRHIVSYAFDPEVNTGSVAHLLRIGDGHYELLYPKSASVAPKRGSPRSPKSPKSPKRGSPGSHRSPRSPKRGSPRSPEHKSPESQRSQRSQRSPESPKPSISDKRLYQELNAGKIQCLICDNGPINKNGWLTHVKTKKHIKSYNEEYRNSHNKTHKTHKNHKTHKTHNKNINALIGEYLEERNAGSNTAVLSSIYRKLENKGATSNQLKVLHL